jgi:hypothetical protein
VVMLRPLRDWLSKEVGLYLHFHGLTTVLVPTLTTRVAAATASIDHLTEGVCAVGPARQ